ncbi:hypothetical protein [Psittacicella hinzii]|uniref:Uncharacterized protein n=1 Tax=Psittacicella hinzii TaxID=2028575 RepID=A0A3A1YPL2_9GAMM|nr:hypothetical protein [Psittacicella hinzii]RIY39481.1 hypothetical protein CKF58_02130 [Psittacicella hinzii]
MLNSYCSSKPVGGDFLEFAFAKLFQLQHVQTYDTRKYKFDLKEYYPWLQKDDSKPITADTKVELVDEFDKLFIRNKQVHNKGAQSNGNL